jgi:hypothetical protein
MANVHNPTPGGRGALVWKVFTGLAWAGSLFATSLGTSYVERQKIVDESINQQKVAEIGQFLNSSQAFYPVVAEFVQEVKAGRGVGSAAQEKLVTNLNQQYSALEASASYLNPDARSAALAYRNDLVVLIRTARATDGPLDAKPFVTALGDALPRRCKVTRSLREAAKLPAQTLDPSCDGDRAA